MVIRESEKRVNGSHDERGTSSGRPRRQRRRGRRGRTGGRHHALKTHRGHEDAARPRPGRDAALRISPSELLPTAPISREQPWDWIAIE